jgi:hypothetical protein
MTDKPLSPGLLIDLRVGEQVVIEAQGGQKVILTAEAKSGRASRLRVQSADRFLVIHDDFEAARRSLQK